MPVPHTKTRMTAFLRIELRSSEPFPKIALQNLTNRSQIIGMHVPNDLGLGQCIHTTIEGINQSIDTRLATDPVERS